MHSFNPLLPELGCDFVTLTWSELLQAFKKYLFILSFVRFIIFLFDRITCDGN